MKRARTQLAKAIKDFTHVGSVRIHVAPRGTSFKSEVIGNDVVIVVDDANLEKLFATEIANFLRYYGKKRK